MARQHLNQAARMLPLTQVGEKAIIIRLRPRRSRRSAASELGRAVFAVDWCSRTAVKQPLLQSDRLVNVVTLNGSV